jgi:hypothetical protein
VVSEGGCEEYIEMTVFVSDEQVELHRLDPNGRRHFKRFVADRPVVCFKGTMTARWKGNDDREKCKQERTKNGRWKDVEDYKQDMLNGDIFPPGVLIHPSLTGRTDDLLTPIDGARRLMASLEAGFSVIPVIVVILDERHDINTPEQSPI